MATRSAAPRRQDAKGALGAFIAECPSRKLLDRICDQRVTPVLASLGREQALSA